MRVIDKNYNSITVGDTIKYNEIYEGVIQNFTIDGKVIVDNKIVDANNTEMVFDKQYDILMDIGFTVLSNNEQPTDDEIIKALERRLNLLKFNRDEIQEAVGIVEITDTNES